jgi:hypothetical protein
MNERSYISHQLEQELVTSVLAPLLTGLAAGADYSGFCDRLHDQ